VGLLQQRVLRADPRARRDQRVRASRAPRAAQAAASGLTQQQWSDFMGVMMGTDQKQKENWLCWMNNYLMGCRNCPQCPVKDPFAN
jgi:hypothetical protein